MDKQQEQVIHAIEECLNNKLIGGTDVKRLARSLWLAVKPFVKNTFSLECGERRSGEERRIRLVGRRGKIRRRTDITQVSSDGDRRDGGERRDPISTDMRQKGIVKETKSKLPEIEWPDVDRVEEGQVSLRR